MKKLLLSIALACASTAAVAQTAPTLDGKWTIHISIAGNDSDMACTVAQKDSDLTFTCKGAEDKPTQMVGKVEGKKVNWSAKSEYNGSPLTMKYEGVLDSPTKMSGSVEVVEFGVSGDFTATQAK